ncbi:hypothetical protein BDR06DRAFT_1014913 [Suillus hirtellus]|nr:hypothetical protein BDR06DRAFT_1014913 [Suillus hirtellus]
MHSTLPLSHLTGSSSRVTPLPPKSARSPPVFPFFRNAGSPAPAFLCTLHPLLPPLHANFFKLLDSALEKVDSVYSKREKEIGSGAPSQVGFLYRVNGRSGRNKDAGAQCSVDELRKLLTIIYTPEDSVMLADVESIINICVESLEHGDRVTTQSLAQLVGHMLAATQMERAVAVAEQSQKGKKEQEDSDISTAAHINIVAENTKILLTPGDILSQIST